MTNVNNKQKNKGCYFAIIEKYKQHVCEEDKRGQSLV